VNQEGFTTVSSNRDTKASKKRLKIANEMLPIDEHRETILERIRFDRVVIIHGETGCGKSSRLPQFLLEDAIEKGEVCLFKIFRRVETFLLT
jgi:HrpA-like RNA helicase